MLITRKDWNAYIQKLSLLNKTASDLMVKWVQENGFSNRKAMIDYAYSLVNKYGNGSAALAAAMYDTVAEASGMWLEPAELADYVSENEVAKTVLGTLKRSVNENELGGAVSRLVKRQSADTMLKNAYRDRKKVKKRGGHRHTGLQVAWIPYGDTCPFCLMLGSRGWVEQTEWAANNHAEHIHSNCDCNYAVRFDKYTDVEDYNPDELYDMYWDANGADWKAKVNSMRREQYAENKDEINAQKRAAYKLRKSNQQSGKTGAANTGKGKEVYYDKNAVFKIDVPVYSKEINKQLSISAQKVAENGSRERYEYSAIIDLDTGKEVDFGSSKSYDSVDYYYKYLREHPNGKYVMVHNHNTENGISLPDVQELAMWENLDSVVAVTNNGITHLIHSNGKPLKDYLFIEFEKVGRMENGTLDELRMIPVAIKEYTDGEYYHDGRKQ